MKIEKSKIKDVKVNPNNPRIIKDENFKKLVKSIKEFPEMLEIRPIVVDNNMVVLGGNMRLRACQEAGLKEVPIICADTLTEKQKQEFIIKDNVGFGDWDFDILANDFDQESLQDWGIDIKEKENLDFEESKNLSNEIQFLICIDCENESNQSDLYQELESRGFKCKLIM